jgi:glucose-6-phosphate isomerase
MISIDFKNVFSVGRHGMTKAQFSSQKKYLKTYLSDVQLRAQGFYTVVDNMVTVRDIEAFAHSVRGVYTDIVVLGIGGSSLGTLCLRDALTHMYGIRQKGVPNLYVLDNIDPVMIAEVQDVIDVHKTLFIVISKSGTTPETMSQYYYFRKVIEKEGLDVQKHMVFVTDPERGVLRDIAREGSIRTFSIPANVGGRFSVLSSVGLLPSALIGIDIRKLLSGARDMRDMFLSTAWTKNLPFQLAVVEHVLNTKRGKSMLVMMPYAQQLARFADWHRQLLAESMGKKRNRKGKVVHTGITPINALGVTDQHSQSQLYNEGPNDKMFVYITVDRLGKRIRIPNAGNSHEGIAYLRDTSFNELLTIEQEATALALTKNKRPNLTISLPQIDEEHLGQLFLLFEGATAFLGEMYGIDAYDQPGVELSKQLTKQALMRKNN